MIFKVPESLQSLKAEALALIDEGEAIEILLNHITPKAIIECQELRELIKQGKSMRRLRDLIQNAKKQHGNLRKQYGITASRKDLLEFLQEARGVPEHEVLWVHRALLSRILKAYDHDEWPAHSQIMIDPHGKQPRWPQFEVRLLEASLYEDMIILFNQARRTHQTVDLSKPDKLTLKTTLALCRATVTSACYFVECYLNGIALRYIATHGNGIPQDTYDMLTEWDSQKKRDKRLPMREKILKYTKIASGQGHPPLQENNCPEMEVLTRIAKQLRDSIVHASAIPNRITRIPEKEKAVFNVTIVEAERVVDAGTGLVRKIEIVVSGDDKALTWMKDRETDGYYPQSAVL